MKREFEIKGWAVQTEFRARGGVTYDRVSADVNRQGNEETSTLTTIKHIDDVVLLKLSNTILGRANYLMTQYATNTPLGWFADENNYNKLDVAFNEVRQACTDFNFAAQNAGSERRVRCEITPLPVVEDNERAAKRLTEVVKERLEACVTAFRAFDKQEFTKFDEERAKCKNLHKLATGIQADSILLAMDHLKAIKSQIRYLHKNTAKSIPEIVKDYDMSPVEAAIGLFSPIDYRSANGAEVEATE